MEHRPVLRADEEFELIEVNGNTKTVNAGEAEIRAIVENRFCNNAKGVLGAGMDG